MKKEKEDLEQKKNIASGKSVSPAAASDSGFEKRVEDKCGCDELVLRDAKRMSGRAFIDVTIPDLKSAYSPYSVESRRRIETGFIEFVEDYSQSIPMTQELTLRIHVKEDASREQRAEIKDAIRAHYAQQLTNVEFKQRHRLVIGTVTFLLGLAVLAAMYFLARGISLLHETLMVLSWVLLWTAFDAFFLTMPALRLKRQRYKRLQRADIIFRFKGD
ncbi:MAG: hypothetical protein LBN07_05005 [Christensenellaceae bacterium]|nr:hypothetical protein [Christensenellaceae bacterium]